MLADIGNGTMNLMYINNSRPVEKKCFTEKYGTHQCVLAVRESLLKELGIVVENQPSGRLEEKPEKQDTEDTMDWEQEADMDAALEFAEKWFQGFQTLVAVHKDKDHIHCHLVTNSVSYEDGKKLHTTKKDLGQMKQFTNQMCWERGKHFDGSQSEKGEVIAWSKDKYNLFRQQVKDSFVADCAMAVLKALENCISKEKFIKK